MKTLLKQQKLIKYILPLILIISLWFRLQAFLYNTFAFTYDVGRDLLAIAGMIENHKPLLIGYTTGLQGIFYGPTWYYILTPFFLLSNGNPRSIALFMVIASILTVFLGYILGNKIGGRLFGLILCCFIGLSQAITEVTIQIWNPNLIPLFVVLTFYIVIIKLSENKKTTLWLITNGLLLGIIFDLEIVFGTLFLLATLGFLIFSTQYKKTIKFFLFLFLGFLIIMLPRILFEFRHDFLMTRNLFNAIFIGNGDSLVSLSPHFVKTLSVFYDLFSYTIANNLDILSVAMIGLTFAIYIKTKNKLTNKETSLIRLPLFIILFFIIGLSFFNHDIESHYNVGIPIIFIILISTFTFASHKYMNIRGIRFVIFLLIIVSLLNQFKLINTFVKSNYIGDSSVYGNQLEVVDYIYQDAKGSSFNTETYTPPIYDYPYQYIFKWYGQKKYGYIPDKNHHQLFYIILEPDLQMSERLEHWLQLREGNGVVIGEKLFPSGIRLQKRIH